MKYFFHKSVDFSAETDDEFRKMAERFERQRIAYRKEFSTNKKKLSEDVLELERSLHDAKITNVASIYKEGKLDIAMEIELERQTTKRHLQKGTLIHYDVTKFAIDISDHFKEGYLWYKYGELLMEDGFWVHNFLFSYLPNELYVKCRRVEWIAAE